MKVTSTRFYPLGSISEALKDYPAVLIKASKIGDLLVGWEIKTVKTTWPRER